LSEKINKGEKVNNKGKIKAIKGKKRRLLWIFHYFYLS
jgi:hypothetical protein